MLAALYIGLTGGNAGADVLVTKTFRYGTPDQCKIDGDIWFCSFRGGVGTAERVNDFDTAGFGI
jgi:hypothetical protein